MQYHAHEQHFVETQQYIMQIECVTNTTLGLWRQYNNVISLSISMGCEEEFCFGFFCLSK